MIRRGAQLASSRIAPIFTVIAQVRPPKNGDQGQTIDGRYFVDGSVVTLCDRNGKIVRDRLGRSYTHALKDGENAHVIAARLTKALRLVLLGRDTDRVGKLDYPDVGYA